MRVGRTHLQDEVSAEYPFYPRFTVPSYGSSLGKPYLVPVLLLPLPSGTHCMPVSHSARSWNLPVPPLSRALVSHESIVSLRVESSSLNS